MVLHVGINLDISPATVYDSETNKIFELQLRHAHTTRETYLLLFQELCTKISGKLGCVCVVISGANEWRKFIIKAALYVGFEKIKLIERFGAFYFFVVSQANYKPKNGDNILIIAETSWYLWHKNEGKATYISTGNSNTLHANILLQCHTDLKHPNVIYFCRSLFQNQSFPNTTVLVFDMDFEAITKGALVKARIMAKDPKLMDFNANTILSHPLCFTTNKFNDIRQYVETNGGEQTTFERGLQLPVIKEVIVESFEDRNILSVITDPHNIRQVTCLPINKKYLLEMTIEKSGIFKTKLEYICKINKLPQPPKRYTVPRDIDFMDGNIISAVGIDLGTTRCCVAVNRLHGIETVALDNMGERLLPSYVSFDEEKEKCGNVAVSRMRNHAKATVFDAKRIIGKKLEEIYIDKSWEFEVIQDNNTEPDDNSNENDQFKLLENNNIFIQLESKGRSFLKHPEEISAALLKQIKEKTNEFQGHNHTHAIIAIPSSFSDTQKDSTCAAALSAGWKNVKFIPEPVAAAFAYLVNQPIIDSCTFLLFDLGGGTLDICIFKCEKNELEILSQNGDANLGGRDFDNVLINHFSQVLKCKYGLTDFENKKYKLMQECQRIKETLSVNYEDSLDVQDFVPDVENFVTITRDEFEQLSLELLSKIKKCVNNLTLESNIIEKVLLVGGGSRMPMIQKLLQQIFPLAEQCCASHPDELVAIGAAYYAFHKNAILKLNRSLGPVALMQRKRKNGASADYLQSFEYSISLNHQ